MATVILGGVGAGLGFLFGGPAGAKLGWTAGSTVGMVVDALSQPGINRNVGKLTDLRFSGSAYGVVIPKLWGANRVAGSIIWMATDQYGNHLIQNGGGGGKGGSSAYSYTATFAVGCCEGTFLSTDGTLTTRNPKLLRVWGDDKIIWEAAGGNNFANLRFYPGSETQTADSSVVANANAHTPYDPPPCFRGTAYFVIQDLLLTGFSNRIPNISIEIETDPVTVGDITGDLMRQVGLTATDFDTSAATAIVSGYKVESQVTAQDAINGYLLQYLTDAVEVDGILRLVPRGGAPVLTIDSDDLGAQMQQSGEPPTRITETRRPEIELPGRVNVTYYSAELEKHFQQNTQHDVRQTAPVANVTTLSLQLTLTDDQARQMAAQQIDTAWLERTQYAFNALPKYIQIAPADVVMLPVAGNLVRMRILSVEIGLPGELRFTATPDDPDNLAQSASGAPTRTGVLGVTNQKQVPVDFIAWSGTELRAADQSSSGFYVAGSWTAGGSGGTIYYSPDSGTTWINAGSVTTPATIGTTTSALANAPTAAGAWDTTSLVGVSILDNQTLGSTTDADVLAGNNNAVIGNEIVGFTTATLTGTGAYTLSRLQRVVRGSPGTSHAIGERFVLATTDVQRVSVTESLVGTTLLVKVVADWQTLADVTAEPVMIQERTPTALETTVSGIASSVGAMSTAIVQHHLLTLATGQNPLAGRNGTVPAPHSITDRSSIAFNLLEVQWSVGVTPLGAPAQITVYRFTPGQAFSTATAFPVATLQIAPGGFERTAYIVCGQIQSGEKLTFTVDAASGSDDWTIQALIVQGTSDVTMDGVASMSAAI